MILDNYRIDSTIGTVHGSGLNPVSLFKLSDCGHLMDCKRTLFVIFLKDSLSSRILASCKIFKLLAILILLFFRTIFGTPFAVHNAIRKNGLLKMKL